MYLFFFFFNDTATTEIYTLSLHDALPISPWVLGKNWTEPNRSPSSRLEASPPHRLARHSALGHFDQGQSPRRDPVAAFGSGHPSHWRQARCSAAKAQAGAS